MDDNNTVIIWVLLDDRAGNRSQCLGVVDALGLPFEVRELSYNWLAGLPNGLKGASFVGLTLDTVDGLESPWPDLIIAAGRRSACASRAIKRQSYGNSKIVQIMYPGPSGADDFDLIAVPSHDRPRSGANLLTIQGAPHGLTPQVLGTARDEWMPTFAHLPTPRIAVFVGGSTRHRTFTPEMGRELGMAVNKLAADAGGSLMISTSRRTGAAASAVMDKITVPHVSYHWGSSGDNPYQGYMACADAIVVSGDSVSMCSEACAGTVPVYIYAPPGFVVDKHARLHQALYDGGYARPLHGGEAYSNWTHDPLNAATEIASAIRKLLEPA
jgi:uncharacterized protein